MNKEGPRLIPLILTMVLFWILSLMFGPFAYIWALWEALEAEIILVGITCYVSYRIFAWLTVKVQAKLRSLRGGE